MPAFVRRNSVAIAAIAVAILITGYGVANAESRGNGRGAIAAAKAKQGGGLTKRQRKQIIALIKKYAVPGPQGSTGQQGPVGPPGLDGADAIAGPPTGTAGGALAGTYPTPTLNVSGGSCPNGQALVDVSSLAALTCGPGVFDDGEARGNIGVGGLSGGFFPSLTTGSENSAHGYAAMASVTSGNDNSAFGAYSLGANTAGNANTALGLQALWKKAAGSGNTAVGSYALQQLTSGNNNVALAGGLSLGSGDNNVYIAGQPPGSPGSASESSTIRIGGPQTRAFLAGVSGTNLGAQPAVVVNAEGQLGVNTSSRRFKTDIHPIGSALDRLMALRPISFRYRRGDVQGANPIQYGLLAEQVSQVYPNLVARGRDGRPFTVLYQELPALLLAQVQRQQRQIAHQQAQIRWLVRRARGR